MHKKQYSGRYLEPKFFEKDFLPTNAKEIEFVRSPFYDLAKAETMNDEQAAELLETMHLKLNMLDNKLGILTDKVPTKEEISYTRYADNLSEDKSKLIF
jgi:hypothetical protein